MIKDTIEKRIKEKAKKVHPSLRVFFFIEEKDNAFIIRLRVHPLGKQEEYENSVSITRQSIEDLINKLLLFSIIADIDGMIRTMAEIKVIDMVANQIIENINNTFARGSKYEISHVKNDNYRVKKTGRRHIKEF